MDSGKGLIDASTKNKGLSHHYDLVWLHYPPAIVNLMFGREYCGVYTLVVCQLVFISLTFGYSVFNFCLSLSYFFSLA